MSKLGTLHPNIVKLELNSLTNVKKKMLTTAFKIKSPVG